MVLSYLENQNFKKWFEESKKNHLVLTIPNVFLKLGYEKYVRIENNSLIPHIPKRIEQKEKGKIIIKSKKTSSKITFSSPPPKTVKEAKEREKRYWGLAPYSC